MPPKYSLTLTMVGMDGELYLHGFTLREVNDILSSMQAVSWVSLAVPDGSTLTIRTSNILTIRKEQMK